MDIHVQCSTKTMDQRYGCGSAALFALGLALFWLVGFIVIQSIARAYPVPGAMEIAVYILLALTISEVAKLMSQLWYYRVGV